MSQCLWTWQTIEPGRDFRKAIDQSIANCSALLAIIGLEWLEAKDASGGRRLDDPNDFVRIELASALRRDRPRWCLCSSADPRCRALINCPTISRNWLDRLPSNSTHARWKSDVQVLVRALQPFMDPSRVDGADRQMEPGETRTGGSTAQAQGEAANGATVASTIDAQTIAGVTKELAVFIGPIAEVVGEAGRETVRVGKRSLCNGSARDRIRVGPSEVLEVVPELVELILPMAARSPAFTPLQTS